MDGWPPINCRRFDGESEGAFRRRRTRIAEIVNGFRFGSLSREEADRLDRELVMLQNPVFHDTRELAYH